MNPAPTPPVHSAIAPARIDFAGGWTDVPPYSSRRGGAVVNAAIALHVEVECRPRREGIRLASHDLGLEVEAGSPDGFAYDGKLDLLKAAVRRTGLGGGWDVVTRSGAPPGGGLGASGALGVALVSALRTAAGRPVRPEEAAELAHRLEAEEMQVAGGKQDQYAAALGGPLYLEFHDPDVRVTRLSLDPSFVRALQERLILCYTGTSRISGETIARVMRRFEAGDARIVGALDGLRDAAHAVRDALLSADIDCLAEAINANWRHQKVLDARMATPEMERVEAAAFAAGAIAGKACGAGAGGCMVFITRPDAAREVGQAVRSAGAENLPVSFDLEGVRSASRPS